MALYLNKNMIDGVEELPRLTEEEFEALPVAERPKIWVKRNATETDRGITAEDVQFDSTQNVKEKIDSFATVATSGNYSDLNNRPTISPVTSVLRFNVQTLGEDVLSVAKNMPEGFRVYANSNNPTNQPTGCAWGGYLFMKAQDRCNIIYMDSAHIAVANSISSSTTSISWKIV